MSRTVTALFESRSEAEAARARLASRVDVQSTRFLAKETAAAVDDLKLEPNQAKAYRDALLGGDHLLVAKVARGEKADAIIESLEAATGPALQAPSVAAASPVEDELAIPEATDDVVLEEAVEEANPVETAPVTAVASTEATVEAETPIVSAVAEPAESETVAAEATVIEETPIAEPGELRIGKAQVARGGARLRSVTREEPAEQEVALREEHIDLHNRPAERRLAASEVEAGGLLKERVFEVIEMREEPVVAKETVVREEVIIRKTLHERTATVRDTVRRTGLEVEGLPSS